MNRENLFVSVTYKRYTPLPNLKRVNLFFSRQGGALVQNTYYKTFLPPFFEYVLKPKAKTTKYKQVKLHTENKTIHILLSRAVCLIFNPGHDLFHDEVDHINGCKWDNRAENLEWVTHKENVRRYLEKRKLAKNH